MKKRLYLLKSRQQKLTRLLWKIKYNNNEITKHRNDDNYIKFANGVGDKANVYKERDETWSKSVKARCSNGDKEALFPKIYAKSAICLA